MQKMRMPGSCQDSVPLLPYQWLSGDGQHLGMPLAGALTAEVKGDKAEVSVIGPR